METRLEMIEEMLKTSENDPFLNYAAALEYKKVNQINKSITLLERLVNSNPEYLASYYQLGKLYEHTHQLSQAIETYKQGKEVARTQNELKTLSEISEALFMLDDED